MSASPTSQPGYFTVYIDQVAEKDLPAAFSSQDQVLENFLSSISEEKSTFAYAPGKWTLRELLQHIIDAERIFAYRALCFARGETATLPSFEENDYAAAAGGKERTWESLVAEFKAVRKSTVLMYESFTRSMLEKVGKAGSHTLSVSELGFIIIGHVTHHKKIIGERYL